MSFTARIALILMLATPLAAQETTTSSTSTAPAATATTATTTAETTAAPDPLSSHELREKFEAVVRQNPPELGTILSLDPTLLADEAFLARYPELARFVAAHPEVRHHPNFYLANYQLPSARSQELNAHLEPLFAFGGFLLFAFALSWVVRTVLDHRRWSRLSRRQAEVHGRILERFGTSAELLEYIKTPAGAKFLEGAPIPLHDLESQNAPVARVIRSVQIGIVITLAAFGLLIVGAVLAKEIGQGMFGIGVIALCIGLGFIASAGVSLLLSRRLGVLQSQHSDDARDGNAHDPGLVR
ncbi:MAG: hypothetical protein M3Q69_16335 [Acidobacteriota bacterium]|nr:hypothetical protein [Acidobacteriota bacterium]